jgi:hypothetical protein
MFFWGKGVCLEDQDLTDVDRQAEMDWFASKFAGPLRELAERFGSPAKIRWGLVFWFS